jgi:ATP synthase protein I
MQKPDYKWMRGAGMVASIGFILVVSTAIGLGVGYWLDSKLGTAPWLMILFTLLGIAAGFVEMFRIVLGLSKD